MTVRLSYTLSSIPIVAVAVASVSISASYLEPTVSPDDTGTRIQMESSIVPTVPLPAEVLSINETNTIRVDTSKTDDVTVSEAIDRFDIELVKADSVTAVESRVKVFTDFIDFDPSDDDVDATPVTISEAAAFDLSKNFSGADDVTPSESIAKAPNKPGITASVSTSEAVDQFRPHKNITDTATTSEAIDRFDVTTAIDDTVTATESLTKDFTLGDPNDSVTVVQSNVKAFTSNVDFDLSDADVDPDPVTATDAINEFDFNKGLTDTSSITESAAKNFTHGGFSDTASPTESTAFDITVSGFADSFTAVEGIKNETTKNISTVVSGSQTFVVTVVNSGGNKFAIDGVTNPVLELASGVTYTFDVSDSSNAGHPLRFQDGSTSYTTGVTVSGTQGQANATVTFAVPADAPVSTLNYYCTVHGTGMGNSISIPNSPFLNQVLPVESAVFNIQQAFSHAASVTESISTSLILGETERFYPNQIYMQDTDPNDSSIRGYHRGLNEGGGKVFTQDGYRFRITDFTGILGNDDSLLNSTPLHQNTKDGAGVAEFVGIIGSAGLINQPRLNEQSITYAETSSAGLLVNFIYTDTDDTELGGHFLNETPLCAGSYI